MAAAAHSITPVVKNTIHPLKTEMPNMSVFLFHICIIDEMLVSKNSCDKHIDFPVAASK